MRAVFLDDRQLVYPFMNVMPGLLHRPRYADVQRLVKQIAPQAVRTLEGPCPGREAQEDFCVAAGVATQGFLRTM